MITGHVRGPGGVSVPGATVQVTELQTGERKVTWTDEAGNYVLADLNPGTYKLEVSLIGFRTDIREPVPLAAGRTLKVNIALGIALPEQAASASPRTAPTGRGDSGDSLLLPEELRARQGVSALDPTLMLGAGAAGEGNVRFAEAGAMPSLPSGDSSSSEIDSSASAANSFLLQGSVNRGLPAPSMEEEGRWRERTEEFRRGREMLGGPGFGGGFGGPGAPGFGGGFGGPEPFMMRGAGGGWAGRRAQVNRLRGSISEEYSNSALNARPYPLNAPESSRIPSYREQFGITLGGPLVIPKVYNGREKTSFFVHYNLGRNRTPFDSFATVPTLAERDGDFSGAPILSSPLAGTVPVIYDPTTDGGRPGGPRTPFPGNRIPPSRFDPAAVGLLKFIPLPNLPGSVQNYHLQAALPVVSDRIMGRVGHRISSKDNLNAFYFLNSSRSDSVLNFPSLTQHSSARSQNFNFGETHTFDTKTVNTILVNFTRQRRSTLNPFAFREDISGELGIQGISNDPRDWGLPIIQFTNFTGLNDVIPSLVRNQTFRVVDFLIWNAGKHTLRLGGELRRVQLNTLTDPDARGTFNFTGFTTSGFSQGFPVPGTGFDFADFLLGLPQATSVRFGTSSNYFRSWVYSAFFEDDWRLSPRWTLNFGLRYEYFQPFTEKYGHISNLVFSEGFSTASVVTGQFPDVYADALLRGDPNNFAPRIGVAVRPWRRRHLVMRAGYGIFYDSSIYPRLVPNLANQPPFAQASTLLTSPSQVVTLEQGFPRLAPDVARNTYAVDVNFRTPYAQTWNFSLEDEIARNLILSIGYVGTKGTKLDLLLAPNRAAAGSPLTTQERLMLKNALLFTYETSGAASIYHGLQVGLRRQFHGGFAMSGNYTFGKSLDNAASVGGAGKTVAQNFSDLKAERGLSVFDVRHRFILNHTYEFPLGERKRFLNQGGALAHMLSNWQISGVATLQTGTPFTARVLGNLSNNSGTGANFSERAQVAGTPVKLPKSERTTQRYFNTAAFTLPPPGQFGNAARNTIPGPGTVNFNMALTRFVTLSREKGVRLDFRVEASNLSNTPNFNGLSTVVNAQDFGRVLSVKAMRSLNISMRLRF